MNLLRQAMLMEPDVRHECGQADIRLRETFIEKQLLWQFSVGSKVFVRYWPATQIAFIAQVRVGEEFQWNSVSGCSVGRVVRYAIDTAPSARRWVDARKMQDDGRNWQSVGSEAGSTAGDDGIQEPRADGSA